MRRELLLRQRQCSSEHAGHALRQFVARDLLHRIDCAIAEIRSGTTVGVYVEKAGSENPLPPSRIGYDVRVRHRFSWSDNCQDMLIFTE